MSIYKEVVDVGLMASMSELVQGAGLKRRAF